MNPKGPDQPNPKGPEQTGAKNVSGKGDAKSTNAGETPVHHSIQKAHDEYFSDINSIFNNLQQRFQIIQTDFERAVEKSWQTQDPNDFVSAQAEYQRKFNEICTESNLTEDYKKSYKKYKLAIQNALAKGNVDELNYTDMAHLSQSLYAVSQTAMALEAQGQNQSVAMPQQPNQ